MMTTSNTRLGITFSLLFVVGFFFLIIVRVATAEPTNPLRMQTRMQWPAHVDTVAEAARYVLAPTGYRLITAPPAPREAAAIAARAISPQAVPLRTMAIEDALLAIAGPDTRLIVDVQGKLVSFGHVADREAR